MLYGIFGAKLSGSEKEKKKDLGATKPVDGFEYLISGIGLTSCKNA